MAVTAPSVEDAGGVGAPGGMSADHRASTRRCPRPGDPRRIPMDRRLSWFDAALQAVAEFWAEARSDLGRHALPLPGARHGQARPGDAQPRGAGLFDLKEDPEERRNLAADPEANASLV